MKTLTITEAAKSLSKLVSRVHSHGERTLLTKSGRPLVEMVPAKPAKTGRALAARWANRPHLSVKEAGRLERDLAAARQALAVQESIPR